MQGPRLAISKSFALYEAHLRARRYADHTVYGYLLDLQWVLQEVEAQLGRAAQWIDLTRERLQGLLDGLIHLKPTSVHRRWAALRGWLKYLHIERGIGEADTLREGLVAPRIPPRKLPPVLTLSEAEKLARAPLANDPESILHVRDHAILRVLLATGLRAAELASLNLADLTDQGDISFRVTGKGDKQRMLVIPRGDAERALRVWLARRNELGQSAQCPALFTNWAGERLTRLGVGQLVKRWSEKCGVRAWTHLLRHTFATRLNEQEVPLREIQGLLGHSDPQITSLYTRCNAKALVRFARREPQADGFIERLVRAAVGTARLAVLQILAWILQAHRLAAPAGETGLAAVSAGGLAVPS